jgi:hypothetical protein
MKEVISGEIKLVAKPFLRHYNVPGTRWYCGGATNTLGHQVGITTVYAGTRSMYLDFVGICVNLRLPSVYWRDQWDIIPRHLYSFSRSFFCFQDLVLFS